MDEPKPLLLSGEDMARIRGWVNQYLPVGYDRDFIADTIILNAWQKDVPHVSRAYVKKKCISAWRALKRERVRNEGFIRTHNMVIQPRGDELPSTAQKSDEDVIDNKQVVETATGVLTPFERRLIWMRYYNCQTIIEIAEDVTLRRDLVSKAIEVALYKMRVHLT